MNETCRKCKVSLLCITDEINFGFKCIRCHRIAVMVKGRKFTTGRQRGEILFASPDCPVATEDGILSAAGFQCTPCSEPAPKRKKCGYEHE